MSNSAPLALSKPNVITDINQYTHNLYRDTNNHISDFIQDYHYQIPIYQDLNQLLPTAALARGTPQSCLAPNKAGNMAVNIYYHDQNNHISLMSNDSIRGIWTTQDLHASCPKANWAQGNPCTIYNPNDDSMINTFYLDILGHISVFRIDKNFNLTWADLHRYRLGYTPIGDPAAIVFQNKTWLSFRSTLNHLVIASRPNWTESDLHLLLSKQGVQVTAMDSKPEVFVFNQGQELHYVYHDVNQHISHIYYDGEHWFYQDLNELFPHASLAIGAPIAFSSDFYGTYHIYYLDENYHISDFHFYSPNQAWDYQDLNALVPNAPLPQDNPCVATGGGFWFDYLDTNNKITRFSLNLQSLTWGYDVLNDYYPQVSQMLMVNSGKLSAKDINAYHLANCDLSMSLMVKPTSSGTLISSSSFNLTLLDNGVLQFTLFKTSTQSWVSPTTSIIKSGECHTISILSPETGNPSLYLDGQMLTLDSATWAGSVPSGNEALTLAQCSINPQTNQYTGGLMNVGIWGVLLNYSDLMLAGAGHIHKLENGLVAFWRLGGVYHDESANHNDLTISSIVDDSGIMFEDCVDCTWTHSYFSAGFMQILGPFPDNTTSFTQGFEVKENTPVLLANLLNSSGYAAYPEGVVLTITDPKGVVYNGKNINNSTIFSQSENMTKDGNSLFSLCINNPIAGRWSVNIDSTQAIKNQPFDFSLQTLPTSELNWAFLNTVGEIKHPPITPMNPHPTELGGFWDIIDEIAVVSATIIIAAAAATALEIALPLAVVAMGAAADKKYVSIEDLGNVLSSIGDGVMHKPNPIPIGQLNGNIQKQLNWSKNPIPPLNNIDGGGITGINEGDTYFGLNPGQKNVLAKMIFVEFEDVKFNQLPEPNTPDTIYDTMTHGVIDTYKTQSYNTVSLSIEHSSSITLTQNQDHYFDEQTGLLNPNFWTEIVGLVSNLDWSNTDFIYVVAAGDNEALRTYLMVKPIVINHFVIKCMVFPNHEDYTSTTLIHETGHGFGFPDLYSIHGEEFDPIENWDYMGDTNNVTESSFLAWHRHKAGWLSDNRKTYLVPTWRTRNNPAEIVLTPLSSDSGISMIALCNSKYEEVPPDDPQGPKNIMNSPSRHPSEMIILEVADNPNQPGQLGVLIYKIDGSKYSGEVPINLEPDLKRGVAGEPTWIYNGDIFQAALFNICVTAKNGNNWTVQITYTGI
jgi:M6 family metalloprotease-like protein